MEFKKIDDYLSPNYSQVRHSIKGIDDSYNNDWDILAELIQNSVDAIRLSDSETGHIELDIDCQSRSIMISDTGIGIEPDDLPDLLKPFSTNKTNLEIAVGEKGVGLKFVIFNSNYFNIKTASSKGASEGEIVDASSWKLSNDNRSLSLKYKEIENDFIGTRIVLRDCSENNLFNLKEEQMKYVLRTRTAIGSTKAIWGKDKDIAITLKYNDINGKSSFHNLKFEYMLPTEIVNKNEKIDLDEFIAWIGSSDRTDSDKMNKIKDKLIYRTGEFTHNNHRKINYYACFAPKRSSWDLMSKSLKLISEDNTTDDDWLYDYYYTYLKSGITVSVKGMPTGITIDHPSTGYAGYWSNIFILFEDPLTKFDIGRKSIHGRTANIHKENAKDIFNDFLKYITRYVSGDVVIEKPEWDKDDIFEDISDMIDINSPITKFVKAPVDQEAGVAAIFYELIGNETIKNIIPLMSGYKNKYDLYAKFGDVRPKKGVFEFKARLRNIKKDFQDVRKMFDEIDCIVCWQITDDDKQILKNLSLNIEEIKDSRFAENDKKRIPHATHVMSITGFTNPIYVIDLYQLLNSQS